MVIKFDGPKDGMAKTTAEIVAAELTNRAGKKIVRAVDSKHTGAGMHAEAFDLTKTKEKDYDIPNMPKTPKTEGGGGYDEIPVVDTFSGLEKVDTIPDPHSKYGKKCFGMKKLNNKKWEAPYYGKSYSTGINSPYSLIVKDIAALNRLPRKRLGSRFPVMGDGALFYNFDENGVGYVFELGPDTEVIISGGLMFLPDCLNRLAFYMDQDANDDIQDVDTDNALEKKNEIAAVQKVIKQGTYSNGDSYVVYAYYNPTTKLMIPFTIANKYQMIWEKNGMKITQEEYDSREFAHTPLNKIGRITHNSDAYDRRSPSVTLIQNGDTYEVRN